MHCNFQSLASQITTHNIKHPIHTKTNSETGETQFVCCLPVWVTAAFTLCNHGSSNVSKSVGCNICMPLEDDEKQVVTKGRSLGSFWVVQFHLWLSQSQLVRLMRLPVDPHSCLAQGHPNFCSMLETAAVFLRRCQGTCSEVVNPEIQDAKFLRSLG